MPVRRAAYSIVENVSGKPLVIRDEGFPWEMCPTVTNDAEGVIAQLRKFGFLPEGRRLMYYDSEGDFA